MIHAFNFMFQHHEIYLYILLSIISIAFSIGMLLIVRRFIPLKIRYIENPVLGNMSALISIIYGVLAGLIALFLINNISASGNEVQREANAAANLYRDSRWLRDPVRVQVQKEIKAYVDRVVQVEWPQMQHGEAVFHNGDANIENISNYLRTYTIKSTADSIIINEMISELKSLYNSRENRIAAGDSALTPEIWIVIIIGTILTLTINYLFGMHFYLHIITVSAATLMCFSMVFLIFTLSLPFQGEYVIEADAFKPLDYVINHNVNPD